MRSHEKLEVVGVQGNRVNGAAKQGRVRTEVTETAKSPRATEKVHGASREAPCFISQWPFVAWISETSVRNLGFLLVHPIALGSSARGQA